MKRQSARLEPITDTRDRQPEQAATPRSAHEGQPPGYLWERAADVCQLCGARAAVTLRFLHRGLCDACAAKPTH